MGNPHRYYGKATVKADGQAYEMKDVEFTPSGIKREDVLDGKGFSETEQGGSVKGKLMLKEGTDPDAINKMDDVTIVFEADTGQAFSCAHAWHTEPQGITTDGMDVEFHFPKSEKIG
ncbi:MAG: phage tail tube protein [Alphaproteobacteria bacterium]|nr:phage tail tube protein [Alphaproteobacteria bacterium]